MLSEFFKFASDDVYSVSLSSGFFFWSETFLDAAAVSRINGLSRCDQKALRAWLIGAVAAAANTATTTTNTLQQPAVDHNTVVSRNRCMLYIKKMYKKLCFNVIGRSCAIHA
jgi:hypothetical protein